MSTVWHATVVRDGDEDPTVVVSGDDRLQQKYTMVTPDRSKAVADVESDTDSGGGSAYFLRPSPTWPSEDMRSVTSETTTLLTNTTSGRTRQDRSNSSPCTKTNLEPYTNMDEGPPRSRSLVIEIDRYSLESEIPLPDQYAEVENQQSQLELDASLGLTVSHRSPSHSQKSKSQKPSKGSKLRKSPTRKQHSHSHVADEDPGSLYEDAFTKKRRRRGRGRVRRLRRSSFSEKRERKRGASEPKSIGESRCCRTALDEVEGTFEDCFGAFDQICNVFTLEEKDIRNVTGRIEKFERQLEQFE